MSNTIQQQIAAIRRDRTLTILGRMAKIHNLTKTPTPNPPQPRKVQLHFSKLFPNRSNKP